MKIFPSDSSNKDSTRGLSLPNSEEKLSYISNIHNSKALPLTVKRVDQRIKALHLKRIIFHIFIYSILLAIIIPIGSDTNSTRGLSISSKIKIKIPLKGRQSIFSINYRGGFPSKLYVNGISNHTINGREIMLNDINNNIILEWDYLFGNLSYMFYQSINITEIDLSEFNSENVWNMSNMFSGCSNVTSINLNNFRTNKVINMVSLFAQCHSLISIDVSHFNTEKVEYMHYLFKGCHIFTSIDVSNFDTSHCYDMSSMFADCRTITSLDISNFDTHLVQTTGHMFNGCKNLISINLANFRTPELHYWDNMFKNCTSLVYINLINAVEKDPIKNMADILLNTMDNMVFCVNKANVKKMVSEHIEKKKCKVYDCEHDWRTVQKKIDPVTGNCIDSCLETTNYKYEYLGQCYKTCPEGTTPKANKVCELIVEIPTTIITILTTQPEIPTTQPEIPTTLAKIPTTQVKIPTTQPEIPTTQAKIPTTQAKIPTTQPEIPTTQAKIPTTQPEVPTTQAKIPTTQPEVPTTQVRIPTTQPEIPTTQAKIPTTQPRIPTTNIRTTNIERINESTNFEKLVETTNNGEIKPKTNIENLIDSTNHDIQTEKIIQTYILSDSESEKKILESSELKNDNIDNSKDIESTKVKTEIITNKNIENQNQMNTLNKDTNIETNIVSQSQEEEYDCNYEKYKHSGCVIIEDEIGIGGSFFKKIFPTYPIKGGEDVSITNGNTTYQLTTGDNELKCLEGDCDNKGMSVIDLSQCEALLRKKYKINDDVSLIYFKMETVSDVPYEKNVQYEIYEPFNKTKLDLSICNNVSVYIYFLVKLSDETQRLYNRLKESGYDLFNLNDPFYLKICTPYKSENGTDVLLEDRKNNYYYNSINETTCQSNCHFYKYESDSKYLKCECSINGEDMNMTDYKKFVPKTFYNTFYDILKYSNYKVLWCYNLAFHIDSVTINYGSIIVIILFALYFIPFIFYLKNGIKPLKIDMVKRIFEKHLINNPIVVNDEMKKGPINNNINGNKNNSSKRLNIASTKNENSQTKLKQKYLLKTNTKIMGPKVVQVKKKDPHYPPKKSKSNIEDKKDQKYSKLYKNDKKNKMSKSNKGNKKRTIIINQNNFYNDENIKNIKDPKTQKTAHEDLHLCTSKDDDENNSQYDNYEYNNMEYEEALEKDKRSMIKSYFSIINREHLILLTFFSPNDFNLSYVKFARFIFLITTEMTLNVYLFSDETMHKIYLSYGEYNFVQHIAQIIMTTVFSQIMEVFICYLSLTDSAIYQIKNMVREKKKLNQDNLMEIFDILKSVDNKIKVFFSFTFLTMMFYWYSIACFCAVYRNTQIIYLKDCGLSFVSEIIEPFILYLIPSIFRAISLKTSGLNCLYKLSEMIPIF